MSYRTFAALLTAFASLPLGAIGPKAFASVAPTGAPMFAGDAAAQTLGEEVAAIAATDKMPRPKKEKLISGAVREAVLKATRAAAAEEVVDLALELTVAAVQAAPEFADEIARAASFTGPVSRQPAALSRLRTAAYAARRAAAGRVPPSRASATAASAQATIGSAGSSRTAAHTPASSAHRSGNSRASLDESLRVTLSTEVGVTHDDNIFLKSKDEVDETIITATPGVAVKLGHNSLAHASASYRVAFTKYTNESAPNARLGTGAIDAGYDNGRVALRAAATYQQVDQNTRDVSAVAGNTLVRRNVLTADASGEAALTAKTSVQTGVSLLWQEYKRAGLVGSKNITVPVRVYLAATPNLAVSTGVSYSQVTPQGGGPKGRDFFYNIGLRGSLTAKIGANLSVGYRTRAVADNPREGLWGFDGSLSYAATPKTNASLLLSRNFTSSALGNSLVDSSYFLTVTSNPDERWQFSGSIGHRTVDYGDRVFSFGPASSSSREDTFWETSLNTGYIVNRFMSANATWSHRRNSSNETAAEFSNNILSLALLFQY